jgi:glycine cleavage system H protein
LKIESCEFPDDLLYDVERGTWGRQQGMTLRVGVTSLLSWSFGTFSAISLKEMGTRLSVGGVLGSLEGSRHFDVVRSPVSGTIALVNPKVTREPELLNRDPYGDGWLADLRLDDDREPQRLGRLPEVRSAIAQSLKDRHVRCFAAFPDFELFDVGVECAAVLVKLNELLANSKQGTVVHVISDDSTAEIEMQRWSDQTGNALLDSRKETTFYHFIVKKR